MAIVSVNRAERYDLPQLRESVLEVLRPLGGIEAFVKAGDRVLLQLHLLTGSRPQGECITWPESGCTVAQLVQEARGEPFLGDSPAFGSARAVANNHGYLPFCEQYNLRGKLA